MKICWKYWQQLRKMVLILSSFGIYFVDNAWRCLYDDYHDCKVKWGDQKTDRNNDLLRCWDVKKSFRRIIRRFNSHHSALAGNLESSWFLAVSFPFSVPILDFECLLILNLGAVLWNKASLKISDALSHITVPLVLNLQICFLEECWTASSDLGTCKPILLKVAFVADSRLRCCVVEKSFFRNIRRFEPHHSALAEVFGFLVFMFNVLNVRDGGGRRQK